MERLDFIDSKTGKCVSAVQSTCKPHFWSDQVKTGVFSPVLSVREPLPSLSIYLSIIFKAALRNVGYQVKVIDCMAG